MDCRIILGSDAWRFPSDGLPGWGATAGGVTSSTSARFKVLTISIGFGAASADVGIDLAASRSTPPDSGVPGIHRVEGVLSLTLWGKSSPTRES